MDMLHYPEMKWLWQRTKEAEQFDSTGSTADLLMAMLLVAEPKYLQQLRPIVVPTINIQSTPGVIMHIEDIMMSDVPDDTILAEGVTEDSL
jgi:hypothetical protein